MNFNLFDKSLYVSDSEWTRWKCCAKGKLQKNDYRAPSEHAMENHELIYLLIHSDTYFDRHFMNNSLGPGGIPVFPQQIKNVNEAIENNQLVTGPHIDELKNLLCEMFGYKYASLTSNGFSSLFSSLYALKGNTIK